MYGRSLQKVGWFLIWDSELPYTHLPKHGNRRSNVLWRQDSPSRQNQLSAVSFEVRQVLTATISAAWNTQGVSRCLKPMESISPPRSYLMVVSRVIWSPVKHDRPNRYIKSERICVIQHKPEVCGMAGKCCMDTLQRPEFSMLTSYISYVQFITYHIIVTCTDAIINVCLLP